VRTLAVAGGLPTAPFTVPCAYARGRGWTADGAVNGALCVRSRSRVDCRRRRLRCPVRTLAVTGGLPTAPVTDPWAHVSPLVLMKVDALLHVMGSFSLSCRPLHPFVLHKGRLSSGQSL